MTTKRKFPKPRKRKINQGEIRKFLEKNNFEVEKIHQAWRHVLAFGKYEKRKAVFKLASTQETGKRTLNEYYWNEAVHLTPSPSHPNFTVPKNFTSGYFGKLFFFICEMFPGNSLLGSYQKITRRVGKFIPQIARATWELENLPIPIESKFVNSQKTRMHQKTTSGRRLIESASGWASQVPKNLEPFLKVIENSEEKVRTCVGHGDFVIRQMYPLKGKLGIIDGEHAGYLGITYYDVAQFYIRLRNDHDGTKEARRYLLEFKKLLTSGEQDTYWEELKPVLIQRYIGDLWGAAKNPKRLQELAPLGMEILQDKII